MYYLTIRSPGDAFPRAILYATPGAVPAPDQPTPTGGTFALERGEFPGEASITVDRPVAFQDGDLLEIFLPGDPQGRPRYSGELVGEPWWEGAGTLSARGHWESLRKAAWRGTVAGTFRNYVTSVVSACLIGDLIAVGDIPDHPATLEGNPEFELLGDTIDAALPVIPGGTAGVDALRRFSIYVPGDTITHRFVRGQQDVSPGRTDNYANCIRFPYTLPNRDQGWFEGKVGAEVQRRLKEIWEVTQLPSRITTPFFNPLAGQSADVTTHILLGNVTEDFTTSKPVFDPAWTGPLADPVPALKIGAAAEIRAADDSKLTLTGVGIWVTSGKYGMLPTPVIVLDTGRSTTEIVLPDGTTYNAQVLEVRLTIPDSRVSYNPDWQALKRHPGTSPDPKGKRDDDYNGVAFELPVHDTVVRPNAAGTANYDIRYTQGFIDAWYAHGGGVLPGLSVNNTAYRQDSNWPKPYVIGEQITVTHRARLGTHPVDLSVDLFQYGGRTSAGDDLNFTFRRSLDVVRDTVTPAVGGVTVTPAQALTLTPGSAFQASIPAGKGVSLKLNGDVAVQALADPPAGTLRWGYSGGELPLRSLDFVGNVDSVGALAVEVADVTALIDYGNGLLRYRTEPVRNWKGVYHDLAHHPALGRAAFETPFGDVQLDVQRVTYDLTAGTTTVQAGSPMASTGERAIRDMGLSIRREIRAATDALQGVNHV